MPRSYSFDHYQVPTKDTHLVHERERKAYVESKPDGAAAKIHYGKAHAETEEFLAAKRMNAELEELAGIEHTEVKPQRRSKRQSRQIEAHATDGASKKMEELRREHPIGALPADEEPLMEAGFVREVVEKTATHLKLVRTAAADLGAASLKLARLPLDVASLAARRIRPRHA
jgi:hypothetical protein